MTSYKCSLSSDDNWERGFAFIISMYGDREGAEIDTGRLEAMAKFLRFTIKKAYDKKADVLKTEIQELASRDEHKDRDCFLCFVNAHGNTDETGNGYIFDNDNAKLLLFDDIIKPFLDSKNLEKKPKVFFINACRGDNNVTVLHKMRERLENRSDVLIVFSTEQSCRDEQVGSFFVQALLKTLASYHNRDHVVDMMTKLIAEVSNMEADYGDKQIPMFESKLSKKLYWRTSLLEKKGKINYIMENGTESPSRLYDSSRCSENPQEADIDILFVNMFEFPERWCERVEVSTWLSMEESICWPVEWLPSNAGIKHPIRVFAFSCKGFKDASMKDITNKLRQDVLSAKLGQRRPLFLVGHSIGAFIIQSFLLDLYDNNNNTALWPKLWDNLLGMAFYDIAPQNAKSWLSTLTSELQEEKGILNGITEGTVLKWLNGKGKRVSNIFNQTSLNEKVLCFAQQGLEYPEAGNHYALQPNIMQVREGHLSICRPKSKKDPIFKRLVDFVELCYRGEMERPVRTPHSLGTIKYEDIQLLHEIGFGSYGVVYDAEYHGQKVAVKEIDVRNLERELLKVPPHPNIVTLHGYARNPSSMTALIVMEKMDYDLQAALERRELSMIEIIDAMLQIGEGMEHLHKNNIIHRDLKPSNVLVNVTSRGLLLKLADFGTSKCNFNTYDPKLHTNQIGTITFMAPELRGSDKFTSYSRKVDVYSYGITCRKISNYIHWPRDNATMNQIVQLVNICCKKEPNDRPYFEEICHKLRLLKSSLEE